MLVTVLTLIQVIIITSDCTHGSRIYNYDTRQITDQCMTRCIVDSKLAHEELCTALSEALVICGIAESNLWNWNCRRV